MPNATDPPAVPPPVAAPDPDPDRGADGERVPVIVTCSLPISARLSQMRDAGLQVEQTMESIGIVTGSVPRSRYAELSRVPDTTLETDASIQLPPPESPIQ